MNKIQIIVDDKRAVLSKPTDLVILSNSDYLVQFIFSDEWQSYPIRTARFIYKDTYIDKVFTGDEVEMPIIHDASYIAVGVYAGNLCTSTPALLRTNKSILSGDPIHADPPADVYNQLIELIKNLNPPTGIVESVNGKKGIVTLSAADVHALPEDAEIGVSSVNGKSGEVILTAEDVGALPEDTEIPVQSVNSKTGDVILTAEDVGALPIDTEFPVESVNGKTGAVELNAQDVGALPDTTIIPTVPIQTVNGKTGDVVLSAADVHALPEDTEIPTVPTNVSAFDNDADYTSKSYVDALGTSKQNKYKASTVHLQKEYFGNSSKNQIVNLTGITANSLVTVAPIPTDIQTYVDAKIICIEQSLDRLVFHCSIIPANDVDVIVVNWGE